MTEFLSDHDHHMMTTKQPFENQPPSEQYSDGEYEYEYDEYDEPDFENQPSQPAVVPQTWLDYLGVQAPVETVNLVKSGWCGFHYFNYYQRQTIGDNYYGPEIVHQWRMMSDEEKAPWNNLANQQTPIMDLPDWVKPKSSWNQFHYYHARRRCEMGENYNVRQIRREWQELSDEERQPYLNLAEVNKNKYPRRAGMKRAPTAYDILVKRMSTLQLYPRSDPEMNWQSFASRLREFMIEDFAQTRGFYNADWQTKCREWDRWWLTLRAPRQHGILAHCYSRSGL